MDFQIFYQRLSRGGIVHGNIRIDYTLDFTLDYTLFYTGTLCMLEFLHWNYTQELYTDLYTEVFLIFYTFYTNFYMLMFFVFSFKESTQLYTSL